MVNFRERTADEKELYKAINEKDIEKVKSLLSLPTVEVDCLDEEGMTPLGQACFKANLGIINELLSRGANVNWTDHSMGYTGLMFAALAGSVECVERLLRAGARTYPTNTAGRTATQMAAFVGNHHVVSIINNFLEPSDIEHFTKPDGPNQVVRLAPELSGPLHELVVHPNISPVRTCLYLEAHPALLSAWQSAVCVLDSLCSKFFQPGQANEVLSLKLHLFACQVRHAGKHYDKHNSLSKFKKSLLKGIEPVGLPEGQDRLLRQSIREYPYAQSQLLHQMVKDLSAREVGLEPTALETIFGHLNGNRFFGREEGDPGDCYTCGEPKARKRCGACLVVAYCQQDCQRMHWFTHKAFCAKLNEARLKAEARAEKQRKKIAEEKAREEAEKGDLKGEGDVENDLKGEGDVEGDSKGNAVVEGDSKGDDTVEGDSKADETAETAKDDCVSANDEGKEGQSLES